MSMAAPRFPAASVWPSFTSPWAQAGGVYLVALIWTFAIRWPMLGADAGDDAVFAEIAHLWMRGALPYVSAFDVKPPGVFALLGLSEWVFGPTIEAVRALAISTDAAAAAGLFFLARRFGDGKVGVFAAALYPLLSQLAIAYDAYSALLAFTVLAFLAALSPLRPIRRAALAGLLIGAAATVKQTAVFEAVALLWIVTRNVEARGRAALAFLAGATAAPLAFLAYFAWRGAAGPLIDDAVVAALLRPASDLEGVSFLDGLARLIPLQKGVLPLTALCVSAVMRRRALQAAAPGLTLGALFAWAAAGVAELILQRSLYAQYLAPTLAPALLIAGFCAARALTELGRIPPPARLLALAALTLFCTLRAPATDYIHVRAQETSALQTAAQAIRASGPLPSDTLYVVNRGAWLNPMLDLAPPTKYVFPIHALCPFGDARAQAVEENLAAHPRYVVVADRRLHAACEKPERWRVIDEALTRDYRPLVHAPGQNDAYDVYERTQAPSFAGWTLRP